MLAGIVPAVVTPFDAEGKFNVRSFERLVERLYAVGVHGLYLCGSSCHPGGNITGLPGYNAAQVLLADLGLPQFGPGH